MSENLEAIRRVIEEHHTIRGHVKLLGDTVNDIEAIMALERARTDWVPGRPEALEEKRNSLREGLSNLEGGLRNHFASEHKVFPSLLGDLLTQAIELEHQAITREIEEARAMVAAPARDGLSRDELLGEESRVQQRIGTILQLVEGHASKEETVLDMVRAALQEGEKGASM